VEWGAAMVAWPPAPRGTSFTSTGGGRHGADGGAARSRPAGAQSCKMVGKNVGERKKIKKSYLGSS